VAEAERRPAACLRRRELAIAAALAALAALRLLVFAGAFPFFVHVDEHMHVDMVLKYARGYRPLPGSDVYEPDFAVLFATWGSPEYHTRPETFERRGVPPPGWQLSTADLAVQVAEMRAYFARLRNLEAHQPPLYYALQAGWWRLGAGLGLPDAQRLYWLRALHALWLSALVLAAHWWLRDAYPEDAFVRLGVPLLVAVLPQDALYYVTPDALSPLLFGAGLLLAARLASRPSSGAAAFAAAGILAAAAVLTKYTNAALYAALAWCSAAALARGGRRLGARVLVLWLAAALPVAAWCARNQFVFGDPTATAVKLERMGWERKPLAEIGDSPLLGARGASAFATSLAEAFWRGELAWQRRTLSSAAADRCYALSSLVCVGLAAAALVRRRGASEARLLEGASLAALAACLAMLTALSLAWRFPRLGSPSAAAPWFAQGRLVSGAIVPFALLYARGLEVACGALPRRLRAPLAWAALAAVAALATLSELALHRAVFASAYNWYHLP
jgi:hypothetical protein